MTIGILLESK